MRLYRSALFQKPGLLFGAFAMDRYCLPHDRYEAYVGWDPALDTFFALVQDPAANEEEGTLLGWARYLVSIGRWKPSKRLLKASSWIGRLGG